MNEGSRVRLSKVGLELELCLKDRKDREPQESGRKGLGEQSVGDARNKWLEKPGVQNKEWKLPSGEGFSKKFQARESHGRRLFGEEGKQGRHQVLQHNATIWPSKRERPPSAWSALPLRLSPCPL